MDTSNLINRFSALEVKRGQFAAKKQELQGRKAELEGQVAAIFKTLEPYSIKTVEELDAALKEAATQLDSQLTEVEKVFASVTL